MSKGINARFGMGKGTAVDLDSADAIGRLVEWAAGSKAGDRLLITSATRKEIKKRTKCINGTAQEYGLALQWRYMREITMVMDYIHPEWVPRPVTEYQAWVLVRARAAPAPSKELLRSWLFTHVIDYMEKVERETGDMPEWVFDDWAEDLGGAPIELDLEQEREAWA